MSNSHDIKQLITEASQTAFIDSNSNSTLAYRPQFVSNDYHQGKKVLSTLEMELSKCSSFQVSVAFITESGVTPLLQVFKELEQRGVPGRILTTDYLTFSDPKALRKLASLSNIEMRMYQSVQNVGFHTKGYLFEYSDDSCKMLIGSSNITGSALTTNKEWNVELTSTHQGEMLRDIRTEFESLWHDAKPIYDVIQTYEQMYSEKQQVLAQQKFIPFEQAKLEPNAMQVAFVSNLDKLIAIGAGKALLISATGTGKTYASAFALRHEQPKRTLFLAHREQILKQSLTNYRHVLGDKKTYGLLSGNSHDHDSDYLFATMQTMAKDEVLKHFDPKAFQAIVVDEVHHAGANSYQKILDYFKADFVLGMTASPDRPDGFDIYRQFDNNIAYEIRLQQAMEEDILCPFHYFGITDLAIDGKIIESINEKNDDAATRLKKFARLTSVERVTRIIEQANYYGYSGDRVKGLIFCSRKDEAKELSDLFNARGLQTTTLFGDSSQTQREAAIDRLSASPGDEQYDNRLDYIFTVDIFNEGVDIPEINQVIMLRPTQSPIIFVQQLGRGLRKADGKDFVVILDFIGNYVNNFMIPLALSGDRSYNKDIIRKYVMDGSRVIPGASSVHFDEVARNLIFKSIDNSTITLRMLVEKYTALKNKLGRIPKMVDFLEYGEIDPLLILDKKGSYPKFLMDCEPNYEDDFSERELLAFEYVSKFLANGMRPHELLMMKDLIENGAVFHDELQKDLIQYCSIFLDESDYRSALGVLNKSFVNGAGDKKRYADLVFIDVNNTEIERNIDFKMLLRSASFKETLLDIISFGLKRYRIKYSSAEDGLVLYEKYSRKDVCRLLDWDRDVSSTMYGYMANETTCPIFVTYNKSDGISKSTQYPDAFINERLFNWMSKPSRRINSKDIKPIINAEKDNRRLHLFIKKSDDEGSDFYYMGKIYVAQYRQTIITDDKGKELPIVNFEFEMAHPVRSDIYEYFKNEPAARAI